MSKIYAVYSNGAPTGWDELENEFEKWGIEHSDCSEVC